MKKLPGVILFLVLVLVILQILTLRALSNAEKRINALEMKMTASSLTTAPVTAATSQTAETK
jgi:hypothetical protein